MAGELLHFIWLPPLRLPRSKTSRFGCSKINMAGQNIFDLPKNIVLQAIYDNIVLHAISTSIRNNVGTRITNSLQLMQMITQ